MRRDRRSRWLAIGLAAAVLVGAAGGGTLVRSAGAVQETEAAWVSQEAADATATTGTVQPAITVCDGNTGGSPHVLHFDPADSGLEINAFRVTVMVRDGDDGDDEDDPVPDAWQSGATSAGVAFVAANTPTVVPASTRALAWGLSGGWSYTWRGTAEVVALGPGGWESSPVQYNWTIGYDLLGFPYSTCTAA